MSTNKWRYKDPDGKFAIHKKWSVDGPGDFSYLTVRDNKDVIALLPYEGFGKGDDAAAEERARLITAAPDLLGALRSLFSADMEFYMDTSKGDIVAAIAKARAAIKAATGAQS